MFLDTLKILERDNFIENLYWAAPRTIGFRFNLKVFNEKIEVIEQHYHLKTFLIKKPCFLRGDKSDYILDSDFETIYHHFPEANIKTVQNADIGCMQKIQKISSLMLLILLIILLKIMHVHNFLVKKL